MAKGLKKLSDNNSVGAATASASASAPLSPVAGAQWYDSATNTLKVYNGTSWGSVGAATASASVPLSPVAGAQWYDSATNTLKVYNGTSWDVVGGGGGLTWAAQVSGYTAISGDGIITDTSAAVVSITLPLAPAVNDKVGFMDSMGTWGVNNLTIARNGQTIMGSATNLIANISNKNFRLVFTGTDWRIT